jgi:hypothetical protein
MLEKWKGMCNEGYISKFERSNFGTDERGQSEFRILENYRL